VSMVLATCSACGCSTRVSQSVCDYCGYPQSTSALQAKLAAAEAERDEGFGLVHTQAVAHELRWKQAAAAEAEVADLKEIILFEREEAKAEIERLRALVREVRGCWHGQEWEDRVKELLGEAKE
jgi:hypothetical protein